jgi:hypothetical protein
VASAGIEIAVRPPLGGCMHIRGLELPTRSRSRGATERAGHARDLSGCRTGRGSRPRDCGSLQWVHGQVTVVMPIGGQPVVSIFTASMAPRSDNGGYVRPIQPFSFKLSFLRWVHRPVTGVMLRTGYSLSDCARPQFVHGRMTIALPVGADADRRPVSHASSRGRQQVSPVLQPLAGAGASGDASRLFPFTWPVG